MFCNWAKSSANRSGPSFHFMRCFLLINSKLSIESIVLTAPYKSQLIQEGHLTLFVQFVSLIWPINFPSLIITPRWSIKYQLLVCHTTVSQWEEGKWQCNAYSYYCYSVFCSQRKVGSIVGSKTRKNLKITKATITKSSIKVKQDNFKQGKKDWTLERIINTNTIHFTHFHNSTTKVKSLQKFHNI